MANQLYVDKAASTQLESFSVPEQRAVVETLERLSSDPLGNSTEVSQADDLHVAVVDHIGIVFSYLPDEKSVIVTGFEELPRTAAPQELETSQPDPHATKFAELGTLLVLLISVAKTGRGPATATSAKGAPLS